MATKSNKQPLNQLPSRNSSNKWSTWKDQPIIIIASAFGAGLIFAWQFILPVKTSRLEAQLEAISEISADAVKTSERLKAVERERDELKGKYGALTLKNPLTQNSPYPRGFDKFTIGSTIEDYLKIYPKAKSFGKNSNFYSIDFKDLTFPLPLFFLTTNPADQKRRLIQY